MKGALAPERFWSLIRVARRRSGGSLATLASELTTELKGLTPDQLIAFDRAVDELIATLDRAALASATAGLLGHSTEDGLRAIACWLISRGRETFERARRDSAVLLETCRQGGEGFGELIALAGAVFEEKTGEEPPRHTGA